MNKKKILFPLSLLSLVAITSTSCSGSGLKHKLSYENAVYQADLNHDGKIEDNVENPKTHVKCKETNLTWAESYDVLLKQASSITELNTAADAFNIASDEPKRTSLARYEILHQAEEMMMATSAVVPLYNYADPYLLKTNIQGIYSTNLGYKFFDKLTKDGKENQDYAVSVGTKAESFDVSQNSDASTANLLCQVYEGAKRWSLDETSKVEKGVYNAKLEDGSATCTKKLVTCDESKATSSPDNYVYIETLDDLKGLTDDEKKTYEGTARWTIIFNKGSVWNDGTTVTPDDLIYSWNRSSSAVYNDNAFGVWNSLFDCVRGYDAWATFGQHDTANVEKWSEDDRKAFEDMAKGDDGKEDPTKKATRDALKTQWDSKFNGINSIKGTGAAGGMLGVIKTDEKTVTVQLVNDCEYFEELLAFPAFFPIKKKNIIQIPEGKTEENAICTENTSWWLNEGDKFACNGALKVSGKIDNAESGGATLVKNEKYRKVDGTKVNSVKFRFIDSDSTMYNSYKSGTLDMIDSIPSSLIDEKKGDKDWHVADQIGLFYYIFNVNDNIFDRNKQSEIEPAGERNREKYRRIMSLLINRHDICENVVKSGVTSADGTITKGITEKCYPVKNAKGEIVAARDNNKILTKEWSSRNLDMSSAWNKGDYSTKWLQNRDVIGTGGGFYDTFEAEKSKPTTPMTDKEYEELAMKTNIREARKLGEELEAAGAGLKVVQDHNKGVDEDIDFHFENFPNISLSTNNGTGLEDLAERIQSYYSIFGIDMAIETQEWQSFSATRKRGDYSFARHGWVADYNDPRTYLDLFRSTDGNNDTQLGKQGSNVKIHISH